MARTLATLDTSLAYFYPEMKHTKMFSLYLKDAKRRHQKYRLENLRESLFQTLETANQYRIILEPILHRAAITYQQKVNKLSLVAATMLRFSYYSIILLIGFTAHVYLHQTFPGMGDYPGAAIVKLFPIIQNESFVLIVIVLVMVCVLLRRLIKIVSASYLR